MSTNLTLTLDSQVVEQAEAYAQATGRSLDSIVETYLEGVAKAHAQLPSLSPQVQKLYGAITLPADFDYKQSISDALAERYGI